MPREDAYVGEIRQSQLMFVYGVGSLLDLQEFSVLVLGLNFWDKTKCRSILEPRLLAALRNRVGPTLTELRLPPTRAQDNRVSDVGVPVVPFPRWMRCTCCNIMAPIEEHIFSLEPGNRRHTFPRFVHTHCTEAKKGYPPRAVPVRFLFACPAGHIEDIPWLSFVHDNHICAEPRLYLREYGNTDDVYNISVTCDGCKTSKSLSQLIAKLRSPASPFTCSGLYPHLRLQETCTETPHFISLGASNIWFPQSVSVLAIPDTRNELAETIRQHWHDLKLVESVDTLRYLTNPDSPHRVEDLMRFLTDSEKAVTHEDIFAAIQREKESIEHLGQSDAEDIRFPEWQIFTGATQITPSKRMEVIPVEPPRGFEALLTPACSSYASARSRACLAFLA